MLKPHVITAITGVCFIIAGCLFVQAYTRFSVNQEQLAKLNRQEKLLSDRIQALEQKKNAIAKMDHFVRTAELLGLKTEEWDSFSVNLVEEPLSFDQFSAILEQTTHTRYYYFNPEFLSARLLDEKEKEALIKESDMTDADSVSHRPADLLVNINGHFLIKKE